MQLAASEIQEANLKTLLSVFLHTFVPYCKFGSRVLHRYFEELFIKTEYYKTVLLMYLEASVRLRDYLYWALKKKQLNNLYFCHNLRYQQSIWITRNKSNVTLYEGNLHMLVFLMLRSNTNCHFTDMEANIKKD